MDIFYFEIENYCLILKERTVMRNLVKQLKALICMYVSYVRSGLALGHYCARARVGGYDAAMRYAVVQGSMTRARMRGRARGWRSLGWCEMYEYKWMENFVPKMYMARYYAQDTEWIDRSSRIMWEMEGGRVWNGR